MEYIRFEPVTFDMGRKTSIWRVVSIRSGDVLGEIRWFGRWRQYAFFPEPETIWNPDCLRGINGHIEALMAERRGR